MEIEVSKFLNSVILHLDYMDLLGDLGKYMSPQNSLCVFIFSGETVHILLPILRGLSPVQVLNHFFMFISLSVCT